MQCCVYQPRTYRERCRPEGLSSCRVCEGESDLLIFADRDIRDRARERLHAIRQDLTGYIEEHPEFAYALEPVPVPPRAPGIARCMASAGDHAGVGPMAAVAGAISEGIARACHLPGHDIVVENGGDIYVFSEDPLTIALFAGTSPLSMKIGLVVQDCKEGTGICTSSGSVGHSLSFGNADAVTVVAHDGALADAVATALGNAVQNTSDIERVLSLGSGIKGVLGIVIIIGHAIGITGSRMELCRL